MTKREQIFKTIGEAFSTPFESRTPTQRGLTMIGVCWAINRLLDGSELEKDMLNEVMVDVKEQGRISYFTGLHIPEGDKFRANYCLKKAGVL